MQNQRMLKELQAMVGEWSRRNFADQPSYRPLLGVVEEVGELAHAHLKGEQGIRHTPAEIKELRVDAIGDIVIYLADYCEREGVSLAEAVEKTWNTVYQRNWKDNPQNADKETTAEPLPASGEDIIIGEWCQLSYSPRVHPTSGSLPYSKEMQPCERQKGHLGQCGPK